MAFGPSTRRLLYGSRTTNEEQKPASWLGGSIVVLAGTVARVVQGANMGVPMALSDGKLLIRVKWSLFCFVVSAGAK
jgi:hypothetical protein